ncbi:MAG TPA: NAD(P)-dependent oxidoreductase [Planctomycetota bacterium]|nr:NAD(P)-dependent oxidoreductase [Planctomycetota bacterium]
MPSPLVLVTGAAGKVGRVFVDHLLADPAHAGKRVRALCHNRVIPAGPRVEVVRGSISDREVVRSAMRDATHVVHLATCKETPEDVMDVAVKGLFWLLEEARRSPTLKRFVLMSGDAALGHFVYPHPVPVTEQQKHSAYEGCYALSKVLEEVMLEQYYIQYGLDGCCLRAPWIMEKDDFRYAHTFADDVFGGPRWRDLVGAAKADAYARAGTFPVMLDPAGEPVMRGFVHVSDLAAATAIALDHPKARQQTFNIGMDEPVDYRRAAEHLARTRSLPSVDVPTPYRSTWLDIDKAKFLLGWRPRYDLARLIDAAWDYRRSADDPRKIWYPG